MVFFLGEMNGKFVQISRFNMRNFAAKRREISRRNSVLVGEKSKALFTFTRLFSAFLGEIFYTVLKIDFTSEFQFERSLFTLSIPVKVYTYYIYSIHDLII